MPNYIITKTIDGMLPSIKNQRRIVTNRSTGKPMSIKSQGAMEYEVHFLSKINHKDKIGYKDPVSLKVRVWYPSRRNDLDIEYLKDLIAKAGIIENDRQIYHMEAWKGKDKDHPRVIFTLYQYQDAPVAPIIAPSCVETKEPPVSTPKGTRGIGRSKCS